MISPSESDLSYLWCDESCYVLLSAQCDFVLIWYHMAYKLSLIITVAYACVLIIVELCYDIRCCLDS